MCSSTGMRTQMDVTLARNLGVTYCQPSLRPAYDRAKDTIRSAVLRTSAGYKAN